MIRNYATPGVSYKSLLLLLLLILSIGSLSAQHSDKDMRKLGQTINPLSRNAQSTTGNYDLKYHRLELNADPDELYIEGMVCSYFVPIEDNFSSIQFDLYNNMIIDSVIHNGMEVTHSFPNNTTLEIQFNQPLAISLLDSVKIYYQGVPYNDGFGSFEIDQSDCSGDHPIMWTLSEPYGAKTWWPCKESLDDKIDSLDMIVTTPSQYRVASNGILVSEIENGSFKTYFWKHRYPIPAYLVAFAVAEYAVYSDFVPASANSPEIEILNYVFPCHLSSAQNSTPNLIPIFEYYIQTFGNYPYENEKYGHAECGFGGGMEHSTMSFMGGFGTSLMAHELAHQWFGDKITCGSWQDIWLNEGFATYLDGLTCEQGIGYTSWENWKSGKINHVTGSDYGSTYVYDTTNLWNIFSSRLVYSKGALLLHMLRWKLGDDDFFNAVYNYINDPELAYDYARTRDLKAHLEAESGKDLTEFFDDWLYGQGWPEYDVHWSYSTDCEALYVQIFQSHSSGQGNFFEMPVPIKFSNDTQDTLLVFDQNSPDKTTFYRLLDFEPSSASFDPDLWLCSTHTINSTSFPPSSTFWTGAEDNDWDNANNWNCGPPAQDRNVVIPQDTPDCILQAFSLGECKTLFIGPNAKIITQEKSELIIED
jgi:hypothetical protein